MNYLSIYLTLVHSMVNSNIPSEEFTNTVTDLSPTVEREHFNTQDSSHDREEETYANYLLRFSAILFLFIVAIVCVISSALVIGGLIDKIMREYNLNIYIRLFNIILGIISGSAILLLTIKFLSKN
jgi:hypothetical protein